MEEIEKFKLKKQLNELIEAGKSISLKVYCGNDDGVIMLFLDEVKLEYGDLYSNLEWFIFDEMKLPSGGLDTVEGTGYLELNNNEINLIYDFEKITYGPEFYDHNNEPDITYEIEQVKGTYLLLSSYYDNKEEYQKLLSEEAKKINISNNKVITEKKELPQKLLTERELYLRLTGGIEETLPVKLPQKKPWWRF